MRKYIRLVPDTGFRIVWTDLKPGAPAVNQRDMPMTRAEWLRFAYMIRSGLRREQVGGVVYLIEHRADDGR